MQDFNLEHAREHPLPRAKPKERTLIGPAEAPLNRATPLSIHVPAGAGRLTARVWDRFGDLVATPVDQMKPPAGQRTIEWERGQRDPGHFILRVTVDNVSESHIVHVGPAATAAAPGF